MVIRKLLIIIFSVLLSAFLIFSIPLINYLMKDSAEKEDKMRITEVSITKAPPATPKPKKEKPTRRPQRNKPTARNIQAGPRFAMDLAVAGGGEGVGVSMDLVANTSGGGGQSGDVDEKPKGRGRPAFRAPRAIMDAEVDAILRIGFCVDASGRAFDLKIIEESPGGMGLAEAGKEALSAMNFDPAQKDGQAVPFCGMEQPFEIRFRD